MPTYEDYIKNHTLQMDAAHAQTAHDHHIVEFKAMCQSMIDQALREHDEQLQIDVQTSLNGGSCSMPGLISDIKKQITSALRKAFR